MTKQRINLSSRQINLDKARAVKRARNGEIDACLKIIRKHLGKYLSLATSRFIIPAQVIIELKKEITERKK